ncbi:amidohydrolase family protein [Kutzneria buriramensis]|uniref:Imidazolonepropionase-like amidohydrolase n=1 Tax=Kutzneria buriramensis TaxID=1045776 RepID=A0A3E0H3Q1_9PSEU|nr:amidohydrolase family protein [Kutzneria buriramensis]REH37159.1 imidazolonepropionase-like amidohydrolase [Kutzneria buriramensis]
MTRTLLRSAAYLDVAAGEIVHDDVLIDGDVIGSGAEADETVDCRGMLLVPGFIDCHTHVALTEVLSANWLDLPRSARALSAVPVLRTLLSLGVTTVRDAWGADAGLRLAVERGWIDGPQLLISLRQVCTTGGIGDHYSVASGPVGGYAEPSMPDPVFDGADGARAAVRRMVRAGADWIKAAITGSIAAGTGVHDVQFTPDEMRALVEEAAARGRDVMVHAHGARGAELAASCGARSIEHGVYLDEQAVEAMAVNGTFYVPTLSCSKIPEHRRSVRLAVDAGVPIAMGTDNPVTPHSTVLDEISLLAEVGLGAVGALRAATINAAQLLRLPDRGEIAVGKRADLVLLDGDDLDVSHLADRVKAVWHNGKRYR